MNNFRLLLPIYATGSLLIAASMPAVAADKSSPDWPCVQKKVENLAASQMWDGPSIEEATKTWQDDEKISAVVKKLASRRINIDEAVKAAETFASDTPEADRNKVMTAVFAGLFETLSSERRTILAGIEKYNKRQRARAEIVEEKGKKIAELEAAAGTDEKAQEELAKLQEDYDWEARVFKERNDNIPIACELPVLIDQRLFELAKVIRSQIKD